MVRAAPGYKVFLGPDLEVEREGMSCLPFLGCNCHAIVLDK